MGQNQAKPDTKVRLRYRLLGVCFFCLLFSSFSLRMKHVLKNFHPALSPWRRLYQTDFGPSAAAVSLLQKANLWQSCVAVPLAGVSLYFRLKVSFVRWVCVFLSRACVSECVVALCSEDIHAVRSPGYDGLRCCVGEQVSLKARWGRGG